MGTSKMSTKIRQVKPMARKMGRPSAMKKNIGPKSVQICKKAIDVY